MDLSRQSHPPTIRFEPSTTEMVWGWTLFLAGIGGLLMAARIGMATPMSALHCERDAGWCAYENGYLFGTQHFTLTLAELAKSSLAAASRGETRWVVTTTDGRTRELGPPTKAAARVDGYRANAEALDLFLHDPDRQTFDAEWPGVGGSSWFLAAISLLLLYLALPWVRSRGELVVDEEAGTLTIVTRPITFLPAHRRVIPRADLGGVRVVRRPVWVGVMIADILELTLLGSDGKPMLRRRAFAKTRSDKWVGRWFGSRSESSASIESAQTALESFLASR